MTVGVIVTITVGVFAGVLTYWWDRRHASPDAEARRLMERLNHPTSRPERGERP